MKMPSKSIWNILFKRVDLSHWAIGFCLHVRVDPGIRKYITEEVDRRIYNQILK